MLGDLIAQYLGMAEREHLLHFVCHGLTHLSLKAKADYVGFWQEDPHLGGVTIVLH